MERGKLKKITDTTLISTLTACISSITFGACMTSVGCYHDHALEEFRSEFPEMGEVCFRVGLTGIPFLGAFLVNAALWNLPRPSPRRMLVFNAVVYSLATAMPIYSLHFHSLVVSRFLMGVGLGITCSAVPAYIFGIAPAGRRGFYLNLHSTCICLGLVLGSLLGYFSSTDNWKYAFSFILVLQGLHLLLLMTLRESEVAKSAATDASIIRLLLSPLARRSVLLTVAVHLGQHLSGVDYMSNRAMEIFEKSPRKREIITGGFLVSAFSAALAGSIIDRFGRKFLLISSALFLSITTALLGMKRLEALAFMLFMVGFNLGLGGIPWFITFEMFTPDYAAAAGQLGASVNWLSAFMMATASTVLHKAIGDIVYFGYSVSMAALALVVLLWFKETKGKTPAFQ
jgi:MFS family permease